MIPLSLAAKKQILALHKRREREKLGRFLVEGVRSVQAAVEAGARLHLLVVREADPPALPFTLPRAIYTTSDAALAELSALETSPGVLAVVSRPETHPAETPLTLVLDRVSDPGNVGTLVRTAAWLGIRSVVYGPGTTDPYAPKAVRASMGGIWDVHLTHVPDLYAWLSEQRAAGVTCYAADLGGIALAAWKPVSPSILILGSEAHGIDSALSPLLDERVHIPGHPARRGVESLNVAVAGALLMNHWSAGVSLP